MNPGHQIRGDLLEVLLYLVVQLLHVDVERVHLGAEQVADDASGQAGLALEQGRRPPDEALLPVDLLPQSGERLDLAAEMVLRDTSRNGADDPPAAISGQQFGDHLPELRPLFPALDLPADPD